MKRTLYIFAFLLLCLSANPLFAEEVQYAESYKLGPGDKLAISVFNQQELTGEYTISGSGRFSMPFIGSVLAQGLTVPALTELIISKLKPDYLINPRVSIEVLNYRPFYIIGEVKEPNSYPYVDGMTYLNAVAIAGGYSYRAKKGFAMVRRSENTEGEEKKVEMNGQVQPGDIIRIAERIF